MFGVFLGVVFPFLYVVDDFLPLIVAILFVKSAIADGRLHCHGDVLVTVQLLVVVVVSCVSVTNVHSMNHWPAIIIIH